MLFVLRELGWRGAPILALICVSVLLIRTVSLWGEAFGMLSDTVSVSGAADAVVSMLKITGLTYLYGISSDICRELGENGIAKVLDAVGRVEIILVAIPYFKEIITMGVGLI